MKLWMPILLALFATSSAAGAFTIQAVDLYPSGAKFVFAVEPGPDGFEAELPGAFQAGSVRLLNPKEVSDFKVVEGTRANWLPPALTALKAEVDGQRRAVSKLAARRSALEQTRELLADSRPKESDAAALLDYIVKAQEMKLDVEDELTDLNLEIAREEEELRRLESELEARSPRSAGSFIRLTGAAKAPFLVEAFTPDARWYPRYTMDLDSAAGEIRTRMSAYALQRTGLDYTGPLSFHTKYPDETVRTPVLNPLRVGLKPKPRAEADSMAMEEALAPRAIMMKNAALVGAAADMGPVEPVMESTLADRIVRGEGNLTGDGREAEFPLGELELKGKTLLIAIPEQREDAWIVVSMDSIAAPLIPGTASLLVDGQPAGSASLPEYGLGQTRIPFGYAPQITAKKEPIVERTGSSWFSGVFTSGYSLEVTNGMKEDRTIIVRDRLPIPTNDKVTLEVKRIEPQPKERDKENRLTWELPVKAGETVKIVVDYTLSYPSGEELQYRR